MNATQRSTFMWERIGKNPSAAIPWYLGTSWLYYQWDVSLIDDAGFDQLCLFLIDRQASLTHRHKHLVRFEVLTAGSGFYLADEDIPSICKGSFTRLAIEDGHFGYRGRGSKRRLVRLG